MGVLATLAVAACGYDRTPLDPNRGFPVAIEVVSDTAGLTGVAGQPLPSPLIVRARDAFGAGVPLATVVWTLDASGAAIDPDTATTDAEGRLQVTWVLAPQSGVQAATAQVAESPDVVPVTIFATATSAAARAPSLGAAPPPVPRP
jgi:hypothetical protein